jgi:hypothetical protein
MNSRLVIYTLLSLILLLGLHLRLEVVRHTNLENPIMQDSADYTAYAYNLRLHGTYSRDPRTITNPIAEPAPDALRAPGYPVFISWLTSPDSKEIFLTRVRYVQVALSMLTLLLIYMLASLVLKPAIALVVVLLSAASPHMINMNVYILTETLFTFLLIATALSLIKAKNNEAISIILFSAGMLGIATLVRPTMQYYFLFEIVLLWKYLESPTRMANISIFMAAFLGILSVWWIRNLISIGTINDPALVINALHHGMYPNFMLDNRPETFGYPYRYDPDTKNISGSVTSAVSAIWSKLQDNAYAMFTWYLSKPLYFFQWDIIQGNDAIFIYRAWSSPYFQDSGIHPFTNELSRQLHPMIIGASFLGMLLAYIPVTKNYFSRQQMICIQTCSLIYLYFILLHIAAAPFPRYSIPVRPFSYLLAIFAVVFTVKGLLHRVQSGAPANIH